MNMNSVKFAYTSWYNDGVQVSALCRGKRASALVFDHRAGNYRSSIHWGGDDIVDRYIDTVNAWLPAGHNPLTRDALLRLQPARAGRGGF